MVMAGPRIAAGGMTALKRLPSGSLAVALDVNLVDGVDHDLGDGRIFEKRIEGPEADGLAHDDADDLGFLSR
jgi:hypothetical protein